MTGPSKARAILFLLATLGGCVGGDGPSPVRDPRDLGAPEPGSMTGALKDETRSFDCRTDPLPLPVMPDRFCVRRSFWLEGDVALARLPVRLAQFGGDIAVSAGSAGKWNVTFEVAATATNDADARQEVGRVALAWSHEEEGGHFLRANLTRSAGCGFCVAARANVRVPSGVVLAASFATLAGQIQGRDVQAFTFVATTGLGAVSLQLKARDIVVEAAGREAYVRHEALDSGTVEIQNKAGPVEYAALEGTRYGQDVTASSKDGAVEVRLRDGVTSGNATAKHFRTHLLGDRAVQTTTRLGATGDVLVRDAALLG